MAVTVAPGTRPVGSQVRRAAGLTLGTIAGLALLTVGAVYGAGPASEVWAHVAGDPGITMSGSAVLDSTAGAPVAVTVRTALLTPATVSAAFGVPLREVDDPAAVPGIDPAEVGAAGTSRWFAGGGLLVEVPDEAGPLPLLLARPVPADGGRAYVTAAERAAVLRTAIAALGWTAGAEDPRLTADVSERTLGDGTISVTAEAAVAGAPIFSGPPALDAASFSGDGRFLGLRLSLRTPVALAPADVISASEAFDLLRHHSADAWGGTAGMAGARLRPELRSGTERTGALWEFLDAEGTVVGQVVASRADLGRGLMG